MSSFFVLRDASVLTVYILTLWGFSIDLCKVILMQDHPEFRVQEVNEDKLGLIMYLVKLKLLCKLEKTEKENLTQKLGCGHKNSRLDRRKLISLV
ncbi:hypothetical protein PEC18_00795 [Paucibacter sp. O1-1]|nr:hypothetical protein [Paucibacter sp. O1-1]MDA3824443.1 hypothetical protein [Paucibacter sp. O1-1]